MNTLLSTLFAVYILIISLHIIICSKNVINCLIVELFPITLDLLYSSQSTIDTNLHTGAIVPYFDFIFLIKIFVLV